ncbi:MAG: hypothetical protein R2789_16950 [Microthrixaceae bacterium]
MGVLGVPQASGRTVEVGGADVTTYREMMAQYAEAAGLRRRLVVPVPVPHTLVVVALGRTRHPTAPEVGETTG